MSKRWWRMTVNEPLSTGRFDAIPPLALPPPPGDPKASLSKSLPSVLCAKTGEEIGMGDEVFCLCCLCWDSTEIRGLEVIVLVGRVVIGEDGATVCEGSISFGSTQTKAEANLKNFFQNLTSREPEESIIMSGNLGLLLGERQLDLLR
jgi:hypothetical protein